MLNPKLIVSNDYSLFVSLGIVGYFVIVLAIILLRRYFNL